MEKIESLDRCKSVSSNIPANMLQKAKEVACPHVLNALIIE